MDVPLQITFRDMEPSAALEARIRQKAERLSRFASDILRCRVTVEMPHRHNRQGRLFRAKVEVVVPGGDIVVSREGPADHAHEDPYVALRDAFDAAVRQVEDHHRRRAGQVKRHEPVLVSGRVARFVAGEDFGFLETADGREVYFHRNSVANDGFGRLKVGEAVRFAMAEGEKGPQASLVQPLGHPPGAA